MKYRALDSEDDYTLGKNLFKIDKEAVKQGIKTTLMLLYGEWWENTDKGTPLFQRVLGLYGVDEEKRQAIDIIFSQRILETNGVTKIISYQSEFENRTYTANIKVDTIFGELDITTESKNNNLKVVF